MIIPSPESVAFNLFGFPIYWYGITMAIAIFFAILAGNWIFNVLNKFGKKDVIISCAPAVIICGILGARFYFCMLNASYYFSHPVEIFDIRQGGLSIHGALIFGIIALVAAAKVNKVSVWKVLDSMGCATILGQAIGRWGNYFNSEAYGLPVAGQKWGLFIPESRRVAEFIDFSLFHPAFLYESVLDLFAFGLLLWIALQFGKKYSGLPFFAYLTVYSLIRFFIEQIRVDSALNLGGVPIAEIMSVVLFVVGLSGMLAVLLYRGRAS